MTETGHTWLWKHGESTLYCGNGPNFWLTNITYGEFNFFFLFSSAIWNKSDCLFLPMGTRHYEVNKLTSLRKMKKNVSALCLFLSYFFSSLFLFFVCVPSSSSPSTLFSLFYSPPPSFSFPFFLFLLSHIISLHCYKVEVYTSCFFSALLLNLYAIIVFKI